MLLNFLLSLFLFSSSFFYDTYDIKSSFYEKNILITSNSVLSPDKESGTYYRCEIIDKLACFKKGNYIYTIITGFSAFDNEGNALPISGILTKVWEYNNKYYVCAIVVSGKKIILNENTTSSNPSYVHLKVIQICR